MKLQVAHDFDGVHVLDRSLDFVKWLQRSCGWQLDLDVFRKTGNYQEATGRTVREVTEHYTEFLRGGHAPPIVRVKAAPDHVRRIAHFCDSHLVTSRDGEALDEARGVLGSYGAPFSSFHGHTYGKKVLVMREHGLHVLIDDNPHEAKKFSAEVNVGERLWMIQFPNLTLVAPVVDHPHVLRTDACNDAHQVIEGGGEIDCEHAHALLQRAWAEVIGLLRPRFYELCK